MLKNCSGQSTKPLILERALLDNGSDVSLCDNDLAMELGVRGEFKTFYLTTQEKEDSPNVGQEINLTVEALDGTDKIEIPKLCTVDKLKASNRSIPSREDVNRWPHLHDITLPSIVEGEVRPWPKRRAVCHTLPAWLDSYWTDR